MENNHSEIQPIDKYYSIPLQENNANVVSNRRHAISHCDWIDNLFFIDSDPLEINKQVIHYVNNSMKLFNKMNIPNDINFVIVQMTNTMIAPLMNWDQYTLDKHLISILWLIRSIIAA